MDIIPASSFIIDKKSLSEDYIIKKICIDKKVNSSKDPIKLEEFSNIVYDKLQTNNSIQIIKSIGGRINILLSIIKKLNKSTLIVCKNNFIVREHEKIFKKCESCIVTNIIKLKVNKVNLTEIELIIFVDIIDSAIDLEWLVGKLSIKINAPFDIRPDNISNSIDANKFFSYYDEINVYAYDSEYFFDNINNFIQANSEENAIVLISTHSYTKFFGKLGFKHCLNYKVNNLIIMSYEMAYESIQLKNADKLYILNLPEDKQSWIKQIISRFLDKTFFYFK
jgi:hypothetical protein